MFVNAKINREEDDGATPNTSNGAVNSAQET
jgi:hypothetical protein